MLIWFILAVSSAITNSWVQTTQKLSVTVTRYSKSTITFIANLAVFIILFLFSYFIIGFPEIDFYFWLAVFVTGILNTVAMPLMLKAYELGEFSSVYSMSLATPIFLLITSFVFLGEIPSWMGAAGVVLTVVGLWIIARTGHEHKDAPNFAKGNLLALLVAFIWSITVNFDKMAVVHSDRFFAPAVWSAVIAAGSAVFLLLKYKKVIVKQPEEKHKSVISGIMSVLLLGFMMSFSQVLHGSALLAGLASYTIAIKRMGVLLGVFWGWLFFHERNISRKLIGAAIAISGVLAILLS
jgi:drug/metabolite transporter (DMT)-like permease